MTEIWRKVEEVPMYSVSNLGRVRNDNTGRILAGGADKDGYRMHILMDNGKRKSRRAHRMVATAFIPNPENKPMINHKNGVVDDNRIENLEWCTNQENQIHSLTVLHNTEDYRKMLSDCHKGKGLLIDNPNAKSVIRVEDGKVFETVKEAAQATGCGYTHISRVCHGHRKTAGGYHWKFTEERKCRTA